MIILLKELAIFSVALFTAILATLTGAAEPAVAPDIILPTVVSGENIEQNSATSTIKTNVDTEPKEAATAQETPLEEPAIEEDPFRALAEAFSQLAENTEEQTQTKIPQTQTSHDPNTLARSALVNIICTTKGGGSLNPISASGVVIDSRGVILTNAHVAQYFLLSNLVDCLIRTGSPAKISYEAELLFIPPSWIEDNAEKINDESPTGNGEYDYALLRITGKYVDSLPDEGAVPYLKVALHSPAPETNVTVAGYPAGFLGGATIQTELYAASANTKVGQLYTFGTQNIDVFSVGGSIVAQQGSSGGPVVNKDGTLIGLIVTSSIAPETANRDLRALTTEYIIRNFKEETGTALGEYLSQNLADQAIIFQTITAPTLTNQLINELSN